MKKTLVALAALAATGAFAQSTVTLYGKIDATVESKTQTVGGNATAAGNVGLAVQSAGLSGSRWGMKGSEDLGGGLKANFQLESGFDVTSGASAQGGLLFGRQAWVGVSGGFGSVSFGRQYSPIDTVWGTYDAQGYSSNSAMNYSWNTGFHAEPGRINGSILYATPNFGGFSAQVMFAPGRNANPVANQGSSDYTGLLIGYGNGPIGIHLGYENIRQTAPGADNTQRDWTLAGSYDFGAAKVTLGYQSADGNNAAGVGGTDRGWMLGVIVPVGAATINIGYARETTNIAGLGFEGNSNALGAQVTYNLSKRTNVYVDLLRGSLTAAAAAAGAPEQINTTFGVGIRHDF